MRIGPIAIGVVAGFAIAALLAVPALRDRERLHDTRAALARATALAQSPPPDSRFVAASAAIRADDPKQAAANLVRRLKTHASSGGILIEEARSVSPPGSGVVAVRLVASGPEKAVIAYIDAIERGQPLTRFRSWRADAPSDGAIRLSGEVIAPWR